MLYLQDVSFKFEILSFKIGFMGAALVSLHPETHQIMIIEQRFLKAQKRKKTKSTRILLLPKLCFSKVVDFEVAGSRQDSVGLVTIQGECWVFKIGLRQRKVLKTCFVRLNLLDIVKERALSFCLCPKADFGVIHIRCESDSNESKLVLVEVRDCFRTPKIIQEIKVKHKKGHFRYFSKLAFSAYFKDSAVLTALEIGNETELTRIQSFKFNSKRKKLKKSRMIKNRDFLASRPVKIQRWGRLGSFILTKDGSMVFFQYNFNKSEKYKN